MPERSKYHGRKPHTPGRAHKEGEHCQLGHIMYHHRRDAERASKRGKAKRCGRCRQWQPVD